MNLHYLPFYNIESQSRNKEPFSTIRENQIRIIKFQKDIKVSLYEAQTSRRKFQIENLLSPQNPFPEIGLKKVERPKRIKMPSRSLEKSQQRNETDSNPQSRPDSSERRIISKFHITSNKAFSPSGKFEKCESSPEERQTREKMSHREERLTMKLKEIETKNRLNCTSSNLLVRTSPGFEFSAASPPKTAEVLRGRKILVPPLKVNRDVKPIMPNNNF